jgi:hypothetical protein
MRLVLKVGTYHDDCRVSEKIVKAESSCRNQILVVNTVYMNNNVP